jgi:hypothetical protein
MKHQVTTSCVLNLALNEGQSCRPAISSSEMFTAHTTEVLRAADLDAEVVINGSWYHRSGHSQTAQYCYTLKAPPSFTFHSHYASTKDLLHVVSIFQKFRYIEMFELSDCRLVVFE